MEIPTERPANADETETVSEMAVTTAAGALVAVVVVLRYTGRWVLRKRVKQGKGSKEAVYGLDDLFNVLAVLTFYGLCIAVYFAISRGMGTHLTLVLFERGLAGFSAYNQSVFVCAIFYNTTLGMIKLSVLALYRRILRGVQSQRLRIIVWSVFGIVACNTTANVLVAIFQCWPIKAAWDVTISPNDKRCVDVNAFYLGNAITGVITDAMVYLLSIPIVRPLQLDGRTKIQLLATMLIGGFAVVTAAVRLGFIPALLSDADTTMAMAIPMNWSVAEPAVGILVSSMPAIRAIRFMWRKPGDDSYGSGAAHSTLKSRGGHIQLIDMKNGGTEGGKTRSADNDSEEHLVEGTYGLKGLGQISRTTELEVAYSTKSRETNVI
ncbi:hypothetical protein BU24DRAFT_480485 [Aaosphaeria arxii CBS 175.79]|uniref:Rhodopsin domain-containing protein n=1 Tax=Aaosphaeria arxii CBS 175.79 TaxID=1450172 RepID=A0A6A5XRH8_9PLEO|nr:uncharacterized protein BU24DRAFT_480485 [Aaosphaeria arxii CBS 175.79]KAF2015782.1 hypothetical protein BU24DRAFT_480485 [Aaosphaeria arxii CBS 175.79]